MQQPYTQKHVVINSDNGVLKGFLTLPAQGVRGALICLHGGPGGNMHGNKGGFDALAVMASQHGYASLQFTFYGADGGGGALKEGCLRTQKFDYQAAMRFMQDYFACPIHVVGESAGATVASQTWLEGVSSYLFLWPAFNLRETDLAPFLESPYYETAKRKGFLDIDGKGTIIGAEWLRELKFKRFETAYDIPEGVDVFIAHGQKDVEVPYEQSLRAIGNVSGLCHFLGHPDAGHGFQKPEHQALLLDHIASWLDMQANK